MATSVLTQDAYDPVRFAAVLVRQESVVCIDPEGDDPDPAGDVRVVPVENVIHVDGDHEEMVPGARISPDFYGGCEYAFLDFDRFPEARAG